MLSVKIGSSPIEIEMLLVRIGRVNLVKHTNRDVDLNRLIGMQHHGRWGDLPGLPQFRATTLD